MFDREMMKALQADGEKMSALTGQDHTPEFLVTCEECFGQGQFEVPLPFSKWTDDPHGCTVETCKACNGAGLFICEAT